jgi:hypothetical protein
MRPAAAKKEAGAEGKKHWIHGPPCSLVTTRRKYPGFQFLSLDADHMWRLQLESMVY